MTDRESLLSYRLNQAEETLTEAERMFSENFSPKSITNRAYYSMFYTLMVLFIKAGIPITTSKHSGVISLFDRTLSRLVCLIKNIQQCFIVHSMSGWKEITRNLQIYRERMHKGQ